MRLLSAVLAAALFAACSDRPAPTPTEPPPDSRQALLREVRKELDAGYAVVPVEDLFVVASNSRRDDFEAYRDTLRDAYRALCRTYFDRKPDLPIAVYLFRDEPSYEAYCVRRFREKPSTPYGFFRAEERKLVMNIATGGGTLIHELVHPLLAADFPGVPVWFNEGFASLHEQCDIRDGALQGLVNWRLPALQQAIREGTRIPLKDLTAMPSGEFYRRSALPYAESRYLCLYLQETGRLVGYYKSFRQASAEQKDATGAATLEAIAGKPLAELETDWVAWVMELRWRR
jgi:hypothetical protein